MLEKIVQVDPIAPRIALSWMLGSRCNYDCMYCPDYLHDLTSSHPDLEKLKQAWHLFYKKTHHLNLPYKISFTGGEVTANKSFLPLVEYLKNSDYNINQIVVTTNGSASKNYYTRLASLVTDISFSVHSEFMDEADFFTKVLAIDRVMIRPNKSVHVNVMNEWWNQDRIPLYEEWLKDKNISYSINHVIYANPESRPVFKGIKNFESIYKSPKL